jgi:hypothetical protein
MSKTVKALAIVAALVALAIALNPSGDKHRTTIKEAIADRSPLQAVLGIGVLTAFVSNYHSVGVASYTVFDGKLVTIGAFGMVFLVQ